MNPAPPLSSVDFDPRKFQERARVAGAVEYYNEEEGRSLEVVDGTVQRVSYGPRTDDRHLLCPGYNNALYLSDVPEESRGRLLGRLSEFVQYSRSMQYEKLYELYLPEFALKAFPAKNANQFAKWARSSGGLVAALTEFRPETITRIDDTTSGTTYLIAGHATTTQEGKRMDSYRRTRLLLRNGEWYFVDLFNLIPG
jgi:hypothetical protein